MFYVMVYLFFTFNDRIVKDKYCNLILSLSKDLCTINCLMILPDSFNFFKQSGCLSVPV